ncbi:peroxidase-like [Anticarsia gemmatalis]|uniref:peroxidase-like n=1 Tax=Anticarsia gemmatalis TaxID=129554 RepID=UPI003F76A278
MFRIVVLVACAWLCQGEEVVFDHYTATQASQAILDFYDSVKQRENCTVSVKLPCDANDWRRTDGSCNNLKYPSRGTHLNPQYRMLPPHFYNGYHARRSKSGKELKTVRQVRLQLLKTGKSVHPDFNLNIPGYGIFMYGDIGNVQDLENYLLYNTKCCEKEHYDDYACVPTILQDDDPWHRFDGIKCMNNTRPIYYQDFQCTKDPVPSPITKATSGFDLSQVYNNFNQGDLPMRSFVNGQLIVEEENDRIWPPNGNFDKCILNQGKETRCFKFHRNALVAINLFSIWFVRVHNWVASKLAEVNPCWDDDTLFNSAREICISWSQQMMLHEWMDALVGHDNLVKHGLISDNPGCRETYSDKCYPQVSVEYSLCLRWFHIIQETKGKLYDAKGKHVKDFPINNGTFRTGLLAIDDIIDQFTQGCFRQPTSDYDSLVDFDMAEQGLGGTQRALDTVASDLHKSRLFGTAPYIDYVKKCTGFQINSFDDLVKYGIVSSEKVELLKEVYEYVEDIDLLAGLWVENVLKGGKIPQTLACILIDNLRNAQRCDRHWYERCNRPHAFNKAQMKEIRKLNLAMLLCTVGDSVTEVQPKAFLNISPKNPLTPCSELPKIDFNAFADPKCNCD